MTLHDCPCLIIPDVHQNISWVESILRKEASKVQRIIFLGDYFDPKMAVAAETKETARFIASLPHRFPDRCAFLVGNHDLPYLYDVQRRHAGETPVANPYPCSGYTPYRSIEIAEEWDAAFIASLDPFALACGYLVSHAGLQKAHWSSDRSLDLAALEKMYGDLKRSLADLSLLPHPALASISSARGGFDPIGGVTWLDWNLEFADELPWPQVVGHTIQSKPSKIGRSWNLDTRIGNYAILTTDGITVLSESKDS